LNDIDYVLGISDLTRQGALRFSNEIGGEFLAKSDDAAIPPIVELPRLVAAALLKARTKTTILGTVRYFILLFRVKQLPGQNKSYEVKGSQDQTASGQLHSFEANESAGTAAIHAGSEDQRERANQSP
jgi:hypothetical protein